MIPDRPGDAETWLIDLPATPRQRFFAGMAAVISLGAPVVLAPFAAQQLPEINAFIPAFEAAIFVTDLLTSVLLLSQFCIHHSRSLLALASGYLFTALMIVPHALTFPGVISSTGFLGAGLQTTAWLYWFWHIGYVAAILAYAYLKDAKPTESLREGSAASRILQTVAIVVAIACGLTLLTTIGEHLLPALLLDRYSLKEPINHLAVGFMVAICASALFVLFLRRYSVLDYWLMVVVCATISDVVLAIQLGHSRFSLGFYAARIFSFIAATTVLVVLLAETTMLYARLDHSNRMLKRERANKLMSLEAMVAAIAHEVRQPLAAIVTNGMAGVRFLTWTPPNVAEVRAALNNIVTDGHRASEVFDNLRALFGKGERKIERVDVNEAVRGAIGTLARELEKHDIMLRLEVSSGLPPVMAHKGQLHELIMNLVHNAIEAMVTYADSHRVLHVKTEERPDGKISLIIEDSGPGISANKLDEIFEPFVSTKRQGMGLGLAICRMIVESHQGELSVASAQPHGAIFRVVLPQTSSPPTSGIAASS